FDLAAGTESKPWPVPEMKAPSKAPGIAAMTFSADARKLAVADWDGRLRVWDVPDARIVWRAQGEKYGLRTLTFSPDGRWLAAGDSNGLIRLWEASAGTEASVLP